MKNLFKNPIGNSIFAEVYIIIIALMMQFVAKPNTADTIFDPMAVLSVFVLSAAVMGYLFLGEPLQMYLNGQKKQALSFFIKTVLSFAIITIIILVIVKLTH